MTGKLNKYWECIDTIEIDDHLYTTGCEIEVIKSDNERVTVTNAFTTQEFSIDALNLYFTEVGLTINNCIEYLKENKPKMSSEQFKDLILVTGGRIN